MLSRIVAIAGVLFALGAAGCPDEATRSTPRQPTAPKQVLDRARNKIEKASQRDQERLRQMEKALEE